MNKPISPKIIALTFGVLVVSFLAVFYVVAWQEPTQAPPGGNVPTPINVSDTTQTKTGQLNVGSLRIIGGTALPTCDYSQRGKLFLVQSGSGTEDGLYACKKKDSDAYEWILLGGAEIIENYEICGELSANQYDVYLPSDWPIAKRFFITAGKWNGNLGGLSGADAKCQAEANSKGYGGTWKALLGDTTVTAISRINEGIFIVAAPTVYKDTSCHKVIAKDKNDLIVNPQGLVPMRTDVWVWSMKTLNPAGCYCGSAYGTCVYCGYPCGLTTNCGGSYCYSLYPNACSNWTSNGATKLKDVCVLVYYGTAYFDAWPAAYRPNCPTAISRYPQSLDKGAGARVWYYGTGFINGATCDMPGSLFCVEQ